MRDGQFELKLGRDNDLVLRCTPHALRNIEKKHGGIRAVLEKLYLVEWSVIVDVVRAGLIGDPNEKALNQETLEDEIFKAGIMSLIDPLTEYVMMLGNGGKREEKPKPGQDEGNE